MQHGQAREIKGKGGIEEAKCRLYTRLQAERGVVGTVQSWQHQRAKAVMIHPDIYGAASREGRAVKCGLESNINIDGLIMDRLRGSYQVGQR